MDRINVNCDGGKFLSKVSFKKGGGGNKQVAPEVCHSAFRPRDGNCPATTCFTGRGVVGIAVVLKRLGSIPA
jgi:hypothetical protein